MKKLALILAALSLAGAAANALADRGWHGRGDWHGGHRAHFGLYVGVPFGWPDWYYYPPYYYPPYYYPPYYYPPNVVVVPSSPPTYVEQPNPQAAPNAQEHWWYYCRESKAYYPYVKQCPGGWERVAPRPPD